jgi:hypothetical protein
MPTDVIIEPSSGQIYWNDSGAIGSSQSIAISGNALDKIKVTGYGAIFTAGGSAGAATDRVLFNDSLTSTVQPGANGAALGDAVFSWDLYAYNSFFRQPALFQSTNNSTSLFTGSIQSIGGIGVSGNASIGQSLNIFNSTDGRYFVGFRAAAGLAATNLYTLPTNYPGTGTSVLQSDTSGTLSWIPVSSSSGSGTTSLNVNVSGSATSNFDHRIIFTTASTSVAGAALSQNSTLSYNPSADILSASGILITSGSDATNTTSGALQVRGGIGATGASFFQSVSIASITGTGNAVINGNIQFKGNGTFGDNATADTIAVNARFTNSLAPNSDNTYDLGAVGLGATGPLMWKNIYAATGISAPNFTGFASTSQAINVFASSTNASHPILFTPATTSVTGAAVSSVSTVSVNPSNSTITATTFSGAFSGNVTGTATTSQNTTVVFSSTPATNHYLTFIPQGTSVAGAAVSAVTTIFAIPSTGAINATTFSGAFSGTLSGYASTGRNVDVQLATTNAIHAVTFTPQLTAVVGSATSSDNTLVYNPSTKILTSSGLAVTALTETTSATTGALLVSGSAGFARSLSVGTSVVFWNGANYSAFKTGATSNQTYTLPVGYPGAGTSVLSSDTAGTMTWVASGTVSGTVAVTNGGTGQVTYTDGQLLIGNSVGNTLTKATLSPGTNISISNGNGSITINNTSSASGVVNAGVASKIAYYPTSTTTVDDATGMSYTEFSSGTAVTFQVFGGAATGNTIFTVSGIGQTLVRVGIGVSNPQYELEIKGELSATNKSFVINHPTKPGMKLRYGSLEGPENGVYVRGELRNTNIIIVPDHWYGLVDIETYTVHLTSIGTFAQLYVVNVEDYNVEIADSRGLPIHCYYSVWAERKDIPKLVTEY